MQESINKLGSISLSFKENSDTVKSANIKPNADSSIERSPKKDTVELSKDKKKSNKLGISALVIAIGGAAAVGADFAFNKGQLTKKSIKKFKEFFNIGGAKDKRKAAEDAAKKAEEAKKKAEEEAKKAENSAKQTAETKSDTVSTETKTEDKKTSEKSGTSGSSSGMRTRSSGRRTSGGSGVSGGSGSVGGISGGSSGAGVIVGGTSAPTSVVSPISFDPAVMLAAIGAAGTAALAAGTAEDSAEEESATASPITSEEATEPVVAEEESPVVENTTEPAPIVSEETSEIVPAVTEDPTPVINEEESEPIPVAADETANADETVSEETVLTPLIDETPVEETTAIAEVQAAEETHETEETQPAQQPTYEIDKETLDNLNIPEGRYTVEQTDMLYSKHRIIKDNGNVFIPYVEDIKEGGYYLTPVTNEEAEVIEANGMVVHRFNDKEYIRVSLTDEATPETEEVLKTIKERFEELEMQDNIEIYADSEISSFMDNMPEEIKEIMGIAEGDKVHYRAAVQGKGFVYVARPDGSNVMDFETYERISGKEMPNEWKEIVGNNCYVETRKKSDENEMKCVVYGMNTFDDNSDKKYPIEFDALSGETVAYDFEIGECVAYNLKQTEAQFIYAAPDGTILEVSNQYGEPQRSGKFFYSKDNPPQEYDDKKEYPLEDGTTCDIYKMPDGTIMFPEGFQFPGSEFQKYITEIEQNCAE